METFVLIQCATKIGGEKLINCLKNNNKVRN